MLGLDQPKGKDERPLQDDKIEPAPDAAVNSKQDKTTPEDGEYITHHTVITMIKSTCTRKR